MMRSVLRIIAIATAIHSASAADIPRVSVCEALRNAAKYNGKIVQLVGATAGTMEGGWFVGDECPGVIVSGDKIWPSLITMETSSTAHTAVPLDFESDQWSSVRSELEARKLNRGPWWNVINPLRRRLRDECFIETVTGYFETRLNWEDYKRVYPNGSSMYVGFGHIGAAPAQIVIKTDDDIAKNPSCDSKSKNRRSAQLSG